MQAGVLVGSKRGASRGSSGKQARMQMREQERMQIGFNRIIDSSELPNLGDRPELIYSFKEYNYCKGIIVVIISMLIIIIIVIIITNECFLTFRSLTRRRSTFTAR